MDDIDIYALQMIIGGIENRTDKECFSRKRRCVSIHPSFLPCLYGRKGEYRVDQDQKMLRTGMESEIKIWVVRK